FSQSNSATKRSSTACLACLADRPMSARSIVKRPWRTSRSTSSRQATRSSKPSLRISRMWNAGGALPAADVRAVNPSRCTHAQEYEFFISDVRDPLRHIRGNPHDVPLADDGRRQVADFHSSLAANDDVTLDDAFEPMPLSRHTRTYARPRDR